MRAGAVVVAGGALNTPQLLLPLRARQRRRSARNLGLHPVRLVYGLFDEPQDAHMVYPITAHCMEHQHDEDGGFVIEATTIQDPIAFATTLRDEHGPMWGQRLVEAVRRFRHWIGVLAMVNDENNAAVVVDEDGGERFDVDFQPSRARAARRLARLQPRGARGGGRDAGLLDRARLDARPGQLPDGRRPGALGRRPERRVARASKRLFVGDGSLVPRTLSVNPSLTIMALATRLADHLDATDGYLRVKAALLSEYHRPLELVERPEPEPVGAARRRRPDRRRRASARPTCTRSTA